MNTEEEILTIAQEECAEVIQVISKGRRFGFDVPYNGLTNREKLTQEAGDVLAMITLMIKHNIIDGVELDRAIDSKLEKLKQWSNIGV